MAKVIVYSTATCPFCVRVKDFLKEHKVKFTNKDVGANQEAAKEMVKKSGSMSVPVIDIDGKIIVGFDEAKLRKVLKIK